MLASLGLTWVTAFFLVYLIMPHLKRKLEKQGFLVFDRYKPGRKKVANLGAIAVVFSALIVCSVLPIFIRLTKRINEDVVMISFDTVDISLLLIIVSFSLFGLIDDIIDIGWWSKIIIPLFFSFPLLLLIDPHVVNIPFFGNFNLDKSFIFGLQYSDFLKVFVIPVYIMVVTNLINMHSGFNGLQSGLSSILLLTIIAKCVLDESLDNLLVYVIFLGGISAFWFYNRYPAKIIEGNIGSFVYGATIATLLVSKQLYFFGVFILIPHICDFLFFMYIRIRNLPFEKYGNLNSDGTIEAPNPFKMKFLLPYYFPLTEKQVVNYLHTLTAFFCVFGLVIF